MTAPLLQVEDTADVEGPLERMLHVDHVGPETRQVLHDIPEAWEGPLDVGVQKEGDAGRPMNLGPVAFGGERIRGGVDPDLVAPGLQRLGETKQGHPHPTHHGPVDLGKERDAERRVRGHGRKLGG